MAKTILASPNFKERTVVRFGTTFVANVLKMGLSFLSGLVIARGLGAANYGDLNFLLSSFAAINLIMDWGTSQAFYTLVSQRRRGPVFFIIYLTWTIGIQFFGTIVVVWLILPASVIDRVWLGHDRGIVLLAFGVSFMTSQIWATVSLMGEALRKTVIVQIVAVLQAVVHLTLAAVAAYGGWLTARLVLWLLVAEYGLLTLVLGPKLLWESLKDAPETADTFRVVVRDFAMYCRPLILYGWVGFVYHFAERWLLQNFAGSQQQGFFSVGQQFANVAAIATASIVNVYWREIAEAQERRDHERVHRLYISVRRSLYLSSAWISCLLIPYSQEILSRALTPDYAAAWLSLGIMLLYPVHQSLGQIQGTFQYASGQTATYAKFGIVFMVVGLPVTYLVLASKTAVVPGLALGASGLAMKLVALQVVGVSIQAYVLARANGWGLDYGYQAFVLASLLGLGWVCKFVVGGLLSVVHRARVPIVEMILGGGLYSVLSLIVVYHRPWLAGLTRDERMRWVEGLARWFRLRSPGSNM